MGKIMHQGVNYSSINDAEHLSNLQDTQISNPADGNILQYDGNTNKWKNAVAQEHTTFNGRSGSILPMAGDYTAQDITYGQSTVKDALDNIGNSVVKTFNGRNGSVLPTAGDYDATQINYDNNTTVKQKIDALVTGVSSFNSRNGSILPIAGDYSDDKIILSSAMHIGGEDQTNVAQALAALANNSGGSGTTVTNPITGDSVSLTSITVSTTDLTDGVSTLATGQLYFVYE